MKTTLCLVILSIFAISAINAASLITENTEKFFIGTWYPTATDPASFKKSKCCVPFGQVEFKDTSSKYSLSKEVTLSATQWVGASCSSNAKYNSLVFTMHPELTYAKFSGSTKNVYSDDAVQMSVRNLDVSGVHASNNTQKVTFDLRLNYVQRESLGVTCAVTLSKAATPVVPTQGPAAAVSLKVKNNEVDAFELVEEIFNEFSSKYSSQKSKFLSYFD